MVSRVTAMQPGWDGHQGKPVDPATAFYSFRLVEGLLARPGIPQPSITPLSYGGLVFEWHRKGWDIEIEIEAPSRLHVYVQRLRQAARTNFNWEAKWTGFRTSLAK